MEEKIDRLLKEQQKVDEKMGIIRDYMRRASNSSSMAVDMVNEMNITEKRIDEKLKRVEEIEKVMKEFSVKVEHVGSDRSPAHGYDHGTNTLELIIPQGKTGPKGNNKYDKGSPGDNGSNFKPSFCGSRIERARYAAFPIGTSYLSLDEIPTMIYFRKSNQSNDWTDGQPFGVGGSFYSDDGSGIDIIEGINIDKLTDHILSNIKRRDDGIISTTSTGRL